MVENVQNGITEENCISLLQERQKNDKNDTSAADEVQSNNEENEEPALQESASISTQEPLLLTELDFNCLLVIDVTDIPAGDIMMMNLLRLTTSRIQFSFT